jgi:sugar phosphate isomerase/epimerase
MGITPEAAACRVQVNIPFPFLLGRLGALFLEKGLNPEIGLDAGTLCRYPPRTFRRVARLFRQAGRRITLHAPFQDMAPGALDDEVLAATRRRFRLACRWLPVFGPAALVCHLGYEARRYRHEQEAWLSRVAATFREVAARAAAHGALVVMENVYEQGEEKDLFLEVIKRAKAPNLKVCLDVGHLLAFGDGDYEGWLTTLWPHIGLLHLHDNDGSHDHHQTLGTGKVPVPFILEFLADRLPRQPLITLEPHQEGGLEPSLAYLAAHWPWD